MESKHAGGYEGRGFEISLTYNSHPGLYSLLKY
jgi:hypothetical protein